MEFDIDVSGEDLLNKNYTICIANREGIIKGFKFNDELLNILSARYGQGIYKYPKSQRGKATFKVRVYCIVVHYLVKSLNLNNLCLTICNDFDGRQKEIKEILLFFLNKDKIRSVREIYFSRLSPKSNAHKYAYLMSHDNKNQMKSYLNISLEDIERFLKK